MENGTFVPCLAKFSLQRLINYTIRASLTWRQSL